MINKIRKSIPHSYINWGKHFPEAVIANAKYGFPGRKLRVIGITGTDGKTTTVNMLYKILKDAGKKVSMISTINAVIGGKNYETGFHVTSPDPKMIQKFLKQAVENGDEFMVLEVTSHALEQFRVWGIKFEIGVITNITHEHLDYHGTFEKYLAAKAKLIKNVKVAVLNYDDPNFKKLQTLTSAQIITFGLNHKADFSLKTIPLVLQVPGDYNRSNALAAASVANVLGIDKGDIKRSLDSFHGLPGRMEEIKNRKGIKIVVDFAHTPNALEQALSALRVQTKKKLIAVFGAASDRDKEKRPMMGSVAAKLANIIILTDEDPRFEDRNKIIDEIATGAFEDGAVEGETLFKEPERAKAIKMAIDLAGSGDIVGIFGKGHEKSMNYQGVELPWSDQKAAQQVLQDGRKD